jgi:hypothetical protein
LFTSHISGQSQDGTILIQTLSALLPLTTLINLNTDLSLAKPITAVIDPTSSCNVTFQDFVCYALARDVPLYLSSHASFYSRQTLAAIVEWNKAHPEYIPYGQSLFVSALERPITADAYDTYKKTVQDAYKSFVDCLKSRYALDCLITIGNQDIFAGTTLCGIPRANVTLDYYNPDHKQMNVIAVGFSPGDDNLILHFLHRLEQANRQAGKIDTRTTFQKLIQQPKRSAHKHGCNIL